MNWKQALAPSLCSVGECAKQDEQWETLFERITAYATVNL